MLSRDFVFKVFLSLSTENNRQGNHLTVRDGTLPCDTKDLRIIINEVHYLANGSYNLL